MRRQATESLQYPSGSQSPVAQYAYDNLDRLISEDNRDGGVGYNATYVYDLAGNRKSRVVIAPNGTLTTTYDYWPGTDKLWTETNDEPVSMLPYGDQRYFAYADGSGGIYYQKSGSEARIGQFGALVRGLPSMWNSAVFYTLMLALPLAFFWPVLIRQWRRIRMAADPETSPDLKLWHRCLCVLLSYIFLVGPEAFQITSQAAVQFGQISTLAWGKGGRIIEYGYDANGSLTSKTTREGAVTVEQVNYGYNLQNRLARVETIKDPDGTRETTITEYQYDPSGIRVQKLTDEVYATDYLVDEANPTGYAQVLQETRWDNTNPAAPVPLGKIDYVIGDDVVSQTKSAWDGEHSVWAAAGTQYLLNDGHGSTRQLTLPDGSVADSYSYDGYGVMLSNDSSADAASNAATSLLYSGEQFDTDCQMYYLRARYYNPMNGLFNRMDPYSGNLQDPPSLHKYAFCHNNPINGIDPTGLFEFTLAGLLTTCLVTALIAGTIAGEVVRYKGGAADQIIDAQVRWFWIGFIAAAAVYSIAWTTHAIWVWLYGAEQAASNPEVQTELHHFATNCNQTWTPRFQEIVNRFGLRLNDAWNLNPFSTQYHNSTRHPAEYHQWVYERMLQAAQQAGESANQFILLFQRYVVLPVMENPEMLKDEYWKGS